MAYATLSSKPFLVAAFKSSKLGTNRVRPDTRFRRVEEGEEGEES